MSWVKIFTSELLTPLCGPWNLDPLEPFFPKGSLK